jgi:IclR family transcriptional regulator, KDG regulon repressor
MRSTRDEAVSISSDRGSLLTLARGLHILEALADAPEDGMTHAALARHLELQRSTLYRYLSALQQLGFVELVEGSARYRLGHRAVHMSSSSARQNAFRRLAKRYVNQAAAMTGEAAHATVFVQGHAVTVAVAESVTRPVPAAVALGSKRPAYSSASGRVFLAHQPAYLTDLQLQKPLVPHTARSITDRDALLRSIQAVRERGYALDEKEYLDNVYCVAVPVLDYSDGVVGTLSVSVTDGAGAPRPERMTELLQKCAAGLSRNLGYEGHLPYRVAARQLPDV